MSDREQKIREAFAKIDINNDGNLTEEEIKQATEKTGLGVDVQKVLKYVEKDDDDGKVNIEEFLRVYSLDEMGTLVYDMFKKIDTDNSGTVRLGEAGTAIDSMPNETYKNKCRRILERLQTKNSGEINYEEFYNVWMKEETKNTDKELKAVFKSMDFMSPSEIQKALDGNDKLKISKDELKNILQYVDSKVNVKHFMEVYKYYEVYKAIDRNGDGITRKEVQAALDSGEYDMMTMLRVKMGHTGADKDRSGTLDFGEFIEIWTKSQ